MSHRLTNSAASAGLWARADSIAIVECT